MIDWDDYRYLLAIARGRTLPAASKELGVALSTVMRRLEKIETGAGVVLFHKTPHGYTPTPIGQDLVEVAQRIADQTAQAETHLRDAADRFSGLVRISGSEVIAPFFLARHLPAIRNEQPGLTFELHVSHLSPSKTAAHFDLSFWPKCPSNQNLFGRKIARLRWASYGTIGAEPSLHRGDPETIGLLGRDGVGDMMSEQEATLGAGAHPMETNSLLAAAALAAAGGPPAFLPCILGQRWGGLSRLSRPVDHHIGEVWAVYRKDLARAPRIRFTLSRLLAAAKDDEAVFLGSID
jgi:DNA-binding transcriptional LysR family regulator